MFNAKSRDLCDDENIKSKCFSCFCSFDFTFVEKFSAKTDSNILNIQTIQCTYTKQTRKIISKRIHIEWPKMAMNSDDGS